MTRSIVWTRYGALGYRRDGRTLWRIYDLNTECAVGPQYRSRAELLADLERFAGLFGYGEIFNGTVGH